MPPKQRPTQQTSKTGKTPQQKNEDVVVSNASLNVKNPIPFEPTGESQAFHFAGNNSERYVPFLAPDDNFFQLLLEAKLTSPTNNSCVNSKTDYCIGKGLLIPDESEYKEFEDWAKKVNRKGEHLNNIIKLGFNNKFTFGNAFVEIIRGSIGSKKFIKIMLRQTLDCRLAEPDSDDICTHVFVSKRFRTKNAWSLVDDQCVKLPIYYGDEKMKWYKNTAQGTEHCVIHLKNNVTGYDYYGMPSNVSCLPQQILEYKGARANIDDFDNNLVVGGIIVLEGQLTQTEADKIGKDIIKTHTGDGKRGRWSVVAGGKGIANSKIQSYETRKDGSFLELDKSVENKIIDANNWDSALFGQHESSGIGNGGFAYISGIYEIKRETVIEPQQEEMINDFLVPILKIHDNWCSTKFSELEITFNPLTPASYKGEIDVNKVLTKNEGRAALGYEDLEDEEKGKSFIDEQKPKENVQDKPIKPSGPNNAG